MPRRLRLEVPFTGGEKEPPDPLSAVLFDARPFEMHPRQIVLGVRIAEIRRGELEHLERALRVGMHFGVGNSVQIIDPVLSTIRCSSPVSELGRL